jgi:hypothetical protein
MIEVERRIPPMEEIHSREDQVLIFDILPSLYTDGTSYDYLRKFPMFDEEFYYLMECATRQNADPEDVIKLCREVQQERNRQLLDNFEKKTNPNELMIELCDLDYSIKRDDLACPALS